MKNIPLVIPVFNQLTYLKNLINWWRWYYPENPIIIIDNYSTNKELLDFYANGDHKATVRFYPTNSFIENLKNAIEYTVNPEFDYYVISDPDIMPHPSTPGNFLEVFKSMIDNHGFHRAGFNLITEKLPENLNERAMIIGNEAELINGKEVLSYKGWKGYKAPIDTTFCLYKKYNGGWSAPMDGNDWGNCIRLFEAFHLGWHIDSDHLNDEMKFYFATSKYRVPGEPSAGNNNNRPNFYQNDERFRKALVKTYGEIVNEQRKRSCNPSLRDGT
jgi:hypothetical protein